MIKTIFPPVSAWLVAFSLVLAACGGGGSSSSSSPTQSSASSVAISSSSIASSSAASSSSVISSVQSSVSSLASSSAVSQSSVSSEISSSSQSSVSNDTLAPISVSGNKILFGGEESSIAGMSLFWSNNGWGGEKYYTANTVSWLKQDWGIKLIRASMGVEDSGGYISFPTSNKNKVKVVVDAALAQGLYVIIDWHSHNAHQYEEEAIEFFTEMATLYGENPNVIYEIYNEPLNTYPSEGATTSAKVWSDLIKPYAEAVIAAIRDIDPDNLIIVGTPTWSQDVDTAANNPITGYQNIAYTLHFYAGTHTGYLRTKATNALNKGIALFVTEWGTVEASGNGAVATAETNTWLTFLKNNKISHANWALNDKNEGASALKAGASVNGNWTDSDLTESGLLVKDAIKNW